MREKHQGCKHIEIHRRHTNPGPQPHQIDRKAHRRSCELLLLYILTVATLLTLSQETTDPGLRQADLHQVDLHQRNPQQGLYYIKHSTRNIETEPPRPSSNIELAPRTATRIYRRSLHQTQGSQRAAGTSDRNGKRGLHVGGKTRSSGGARDPHYNSDPLNDNKGGGTGVCGGRISEDNEE